MRGRGCLDGDGTTGELGNLLAPAVVAVFTAVFASLEMPASRKIPDCHPTAHKKIFHWMLRIVGLDSLFAVAVPLARLCASISNTSLIFVP